MLLLRLNIALMKDDSSVKELRESISDISVRCFLTQNCFICADWSLRWSWSLRQGLIWWQCILASRLISQYYEIDDSMRFKSKICCYITSSLSQMHVWRLNRVDVCKNPLIYAYVYKFNCWLLTVVNCVTCCVSGGILTVSYVDPSAYGIHTHVR